ncbi:MAG: hypothetical protein VR71_11590 [Roseovarius sp. BRH_c41]|uniref:PaaI family thioesterase n=1 Tax=Roseovarius sp. BRH_c41 TaxID=1629709 RepID=UPI0005F1F498|nr:PaaI family thioesterase [Roseovarius sp. BRH_c41]KJS43103.1 MAG: hypothetical protein VR71_11590 [Roseovarius sp. BRH_c41]
MISALEGHGEPFRQDDRLLAFIADIQIHKSDTCLTFDVSLKDEALNPLGILHGGALGALFDVAMYEVAKRCGEMVTVSQETKFLSAIRAERPLQIVAEPLRLGRTSACCTARAVQGEKICGFATAQYARIEVRAT